MTKVKDLSLLTPVAEFSTFMEMRMENDANGNPIYIGYNKSPNAGTDSLSWFIVKITYDANQSPTLQELPDQGVRFIYSWDDRTTYF